MHLNRPLGIVALNTGLDLLVSSEYKSLTGLALIAFHERSIHLQTDEIVTKLA